MNIPFFDNEVEILHIGLDVGMSKEGVKLHGVVQGLFTTPKTNEASPSFA